MPDLSAFAGVFVAIGGIVGLIFVLAIFFKAFYTKIPQGTALIVNDLGPTPKVSFTGAFVIPVIHKKEEMRISLITMEVDRRGSDGLICKDNIRADINVAFYLRVNETREDVLRVAKAIGVDRASDKVAVNELFNAKFSEALKTVGKQMDFTDLFENRIVFREKIIEVIGDDLNGYALEDVAIDYLEQTPKASLDESNIMDSEGIRKITALTAEQNVVTNELERNEELAIKKKNVETKEAMLSLELQEKDAVARQQREVLSVQAREEAETKRVQEEERQKAEQARLIAEQEISVQNENVQREIEVAEQNRQRAVAIEVEKVQRAKDLEVVAREREVDIQTIEKDKAIENEKREIANVIRERVAVEKTVAQEEEKIKEVRVVSEADRNKQATIISAQAAAEEELVKEVKASEADATKATFKAKEINTIAQAELEAAAKQAEAEKRIAEGQQASNAAPGLADAQVQEAKADALEKEGIAEAKVIAEKMLAEAKGQEAKAVAAEKEGLAEARVLEEKLGAEAAGEEQMGLALAKAEREKGMASADVIKAKFINEAQGLVEKFGALNAMNEQSRSHEEFRMELEKNFEEAMATISANKDIANDQAQVMAEALKQANIDIVGGDGDFLKSITKSLSAGKSVEAFMQETPAIQDMIGNLFGKNAGKVIEAVTNKSSDA
ncbi:hypothetical protein [Agaribacterium sp. ZY112]|uniref:flotillin family protein n=1 Tax=Agaribacterium sp. ZY112 TaxID=3233574 RepID=UPI003525A2BF